MTAATIPTPRQVFRDAPTFAETFLRILDKDGKLIRFRHNSIQERYLRNRTKRNIILKPRQIGFSTAILGEHFRLSTTRTTMITTITDADKNTQRFRRRVDRFYDNLPEDFRPNRKYSNASVSTYPDTDSEWEITTAGSKNTGRSGTNTHIHGSEVAFWVDPAAIMRGLMQAGNPAIELESTANGAVGYFYDLSMETLDGATDLRRGYIDGKNGWRLHFFRWWEHPEYIAPVPIGFAPDQDDTVSAWGYTSEDELMARHGVTPAQIMWRRGKITELKQDFIQEYPEDPITCFVTSGNAYFGDLRGAFTVAPDSRQPVSGHEYYGGLDFGQEQDYTVCAIYDKTANEMVAMYRQRQASWTEMREESVKLMKAWAVRGCLAEKNSMGSTNAEELRKEIGNGFRLTEFQTTNESKTDIMVALRNNVHENGMKLLNDPVLKHEMNSFVRTRLPGGGWRLAARTSGDGQRGSAEVGHDDTVIALALALQAATSHRVATVRSYMDAL